VVLTEGVPIEFKREAVRNLINLDPDHGEIMTPEGSLPYLLDFAIRKGLMPKSH
jgi:hypothetical protein